MEHKVLIVEDDLSIARLIKLNLNLAGYLTESVEDGLLAFERIQKEKFDLILLDVMIPGMDGFKLMEKIRSLNIPVIFLTAKTSTMDKVDGLRLGADDYMVKPFEAIELLARIEAVLRRYGKVHKLLTYKNITVNDEKREVELNGNVVYLTVKEYDLFLTLLKNKNIALSREQLIEKVWGIDYYGETRTVDMHINALRKKLGLQEEIKTVYKIGYRLED
ncbi:response regulator transcription factor [Turicibacter sanguinis]|nr:response regulator transcription factor [Turicibacter sanguinis]